MEISKQVVVVTGSSSGIGKTIALSLGAKGAKVVVHSRKNKSGGDEVVSKILKSGGEAVHVQADLTTPKGAEKLIKEAATTYGNVDILVNNAGEYKPGDVHNFETWEYEISSLLMSCVYTTSYFLKRKAKSQRKIVNISSMYGLLYSGQDDAPAYSAAKAAMNSLTINLAKQYKNDVLVNAVAPGWTWTPNWGDDKSQFEDDIRENATIGRFIEPEEIAQMVVAVLENDALTGQIIPVEGGATFKKMF